MGRVGVKTRFGARVRVRVRVSGQWSVVSGQWSVVRGRVKARARAGARVRVSGHGHGHGQWSEPGSVVRAGVRVRGGVQEFRAGGLKSLKGDSGSVVRAGAQAAEPGFNPSPDY